MEAKDKDPIFIIPPKEAQFEEVTQQNPWEVMQNQHIDMHKSLQAVIAANGVITVLLAKICEHLKIDLTQIIEEMKKGKPNG